MEPKLTAFQRHRKSQWDTLRVLVNEHGDACRADEIKGGGDPIDFDVIEAALRLAEAALDAHIEKMQREEM